MRKTILFLLLALIVLTAVSCDLIEGAFLKSYYTDFLTDNGDFTFNSDSDTYEKIEVKEGMLYLRAAEYEGQKEGSQAAFFKELPVNSVISFTVKFGEQFNDHPYAHFNLLKDTPDNRINLMPNADDFSYFTTVNAVQTNAVINDTGLNIDQWYSFQIHMKLESVDVYVDETLVGSFTYPAGMSEKGIFVFECHNEYWVDDFGFEILN